MTLAQINSLEQSLSLALQKVERWRYAYLLRTKCEDSGGFFTPSSIRKSEGEVRHAETILVAALDALHDEITSTIEESIARGCDAAVASLQENK